MKISNARRKMEEKVKFLELPDGRQISYREQGLPKQKATRSLLVLHGLGSSRLASMPGVSEDLLEEMGLRLVSIDRPGYGLSSPHPQQTFETAAKDVANIADILELGEKIWLLGYSCGGAFCWGTAHHIPERIAGIAMWAPAGNYWWKEITEAERNAIMGELALKVWMMMNLTKLVPSWLVQAYVRFVMINNLVGRKWMDNARTQLSPADQRNLDLAASSDLMIRDSTESAKQNGFGLAHDLHLLTSHWGFELSDVVKVYRGPLHIWQGDEDRLVPLSLQRLIKKKIPDLVTLHELPGEGHLSPFCFNDEGHRNTLTALFGETRERSDDESLKDTPDAIRSKLGNGAANDRMFGVRPQDFVKEGQVESESVVTKSETKQGVHV